MDDKKGVSIAFNTIIIAIIGLLVLVVIVFMLMRGTGDMESGTKCSRAGGRCVEDISSCTTHALPEYDSNGKRLCDYGVCCSIVPRS